MYSQMKGIIHPTRGGLLCAELGPATPMDLKRDSPALRRAPTAAVSAESSAAAAVAVATIKLELAKGDGVIACSAVGSAALAAATAALTGSGGSEKKWSSAGLKFAEGNPKPYSAVLTDAQWNDVCSLVCDHTRHMEHFKAFKDPLMSWCIGKNILSRQVYTALAEVQLRHTVEHQLVDPNSDYKLCTCLEAVNGNVVCPERVYKELFCAADLLDIDERVLELWNAVFNQIASRSKKSKMEYLDYVLAHAFPSAPKEPEGKKQPKKQKRTRQSGRVNPKRIKATESPAAAAATSASQSDAGDKGDDENDKENDNRSLDRGNSSESEFTDKQKAAIDRAAMDRFNAASKVGAI